MSGAERSEWKQERGCLEDACAEVEESGGSPKQPVVHARFWRSAL